MRNNMINKLQQFKWIKQYNLKKKDLVLNSFKNFNQNKKNNE